ncbi:hypothetical protein CEXT_3441 [Caerostris extrusa]|uniref:Uncharacterized protein n=1 Tax=Caerostris extrusa TaxID=172846 RepID=A0AAV4Q7A3_CAEEX|nr:hypothetical protein CEXT_3441 [Caerostris extrusa]
MCLQGGRTDLALHYQRYRKCHLSAELYERSTDSAHFYKQGQVPRNEFSIINGSGFQTKIKRSSHQDSLPKYNYVLAKYDQSNRITQKVEPKDPCSRVNADLVRNIDFETITASEIMFINAITALWKDPGKQK